jgi:hypothetical protein
VKPTGQKAGQYRRVEFYLYFSSTNENDRELFDVSLIAKGDKTEKVHMAEGLYEMCDKETDLYTFTIIWL